MGQLTERLRLKLKLKRLNIKIDEMVHENFGYCPNYKHFHDTQDEVQKLMDIARVKYPDIYLEQLERE